MLEIGLIGHGPHWPARYIPALEKLGQRIRVRGVYSAVSGLAEPIAEKFRCPVATGIRCLLERQDIRAVLLMDEGWMSEMIVQQACELGRPVFLGGRLGLQFGYQQEWRATAEDLGILLMPELAARFTPSTFRIRELMVTSLGRLRKIQVSLHWPTGESAPRSFGELPPWLIQHFRSLLDWSQHLCGWPAADIHVQEGTPGAADSLLTQVRFRPHSPGLSELILELALHSGTASHPVPPTSSGSTFPSSPALVSPVLDSSVPETSVSRIATASGNGQQKKTAPAGSAIPPPNPDSLLRMHLIDPLLQLPERIQCECHMAFQAGSMQLYSPWELSWCLSQRNEPHAENLEHERSEVDVLLDHFCRRVAGGLLPVPTLADVQVVEKVLGTLARSWELRTPLSCS